MKNLDLNAMGVNEMNEVEMASIEGGSLWVTIIEVIKNIGKALL